MRYTIFFLSYASFINKKGRYETYIPNDISKIKINFIMRKIASNFDNEPP